MKTLFLALAAIASPIGAQAQQSPAPAVEAKSARVPSFVPADFNPPTLVAAPGFKLVPLGPDVVKADFDAYMSSIEHLQKTFTRSTKWPTPGITAADSMRDMQGEQALFRSRRSFDYSVLTPDGSRERGSVYVSPSPVPGYDAIVRLWVTKAEHDAGFDAELYAWVTRWVQAAWPFRKVAYPGRSIDWRTWDAMVAANRPGKAGPGE
jgi:hypothetical protein